MTILFKFNLLSAFDFDVKCTVYDKDDTSELQIEK